MVFGGFWFFLGGLTGCFDRFDRVLKYMSNLAHFGSHSLRSTELEYHFWADGQAAWNWSAIHGGEFNFAAFCQGMLGL